MRKIISALLSSLAAYAVLVSCTQKKQSDLLLGEINSLYLKTIGTNRISSRLYNINGKTYHVIAYLEKDDTKKLEIEIHSRGNLECKYSDKGLDGLVEHEPKPVKTKEKVETLGRSVEYTFKLAEDPLQYKEEYGKLVNLLLRHE